MNGAQHTPGPWRTGDMFKTVFGPPNGMPSPETIATVRKAANARLIAAAPDMLEALQFIVDFNGSSRGPQALIEEFKFRARAAISKAVQS
jgi:hypothetical protein